MNLFKEIDKSDREIDRKINAAFHAIFEDEQEKFYFETPDKRMGYLLDTGNHDVRTEGMSYGMMMAVQMDAQALFDKLWLFSVTYMRQTQGKYRGYFAWSCKPTGEHNAEGPAPDGEEYFAMALLFASARWGDREPPFDYAAQARDILRHCVHQDTLVPGGRAMWDPNNHLIRFVPEADYSDPSYHLPHFYALFSRFCDPEDQDFWKRAANASRAYLEKACHPKTGMASEYAEFDGTPRMMFGKRMQFYSDAYRVAMNIGLDALWFGKNPKLSQAADNLQQFIFKNTVWMEYDSYLIDGTPLGEPAMHPVAVAATTAAASLAAVNEQKHHWVRAFWALEQRKGDRRYYDNCLYFFCLLMMAGRYHIFL